MQEYLIAKQTVEHILGIDWKNEEEKRQKEQEQQAKSPPPPSAQFETHGLNPQHSEKPLVASFFMEV